MYENLIEELHAHDPVAAAWVRVVQPPPDNCGGTYYESTPIDEVNQFLWKNTPQGEAFWQDIYMKLGGSWQKAWD